MPMSDNTRSGVAASMRASPSLPSLAAATRKPASSRISTISVRMEASSSTTRMLSPGMNSPQPRRGGPPHPQGYAHPGRPVNGNLGSARDERPHRGHDRVGGEPVGLHQLARLAGARALADAEDGD